MAEQSAADEKAPAVKTRAEVTAELTAPGGTFEMEEVVIRGIPTRTWKTAPATLRSVLELSGFHGDKDFLVYEDERMTFAQHYATVAALSRQLAGRFGVRPGDRVAIAMRNLPEWVVAFWAAIATGAIVVPLNAWWTGDELAYGLSDSGSKVVFVDEERQGRIAHHLAEIPALEAMVVTCEEHDPRAAGGRRWAPSSSARAPIRCRCSPSTRRSVRWAVTPRCPTWPSPPTTTPPSSTPRARRADPRERWAPIATVSPTS